MPADRRKLEIDAATGLLTVKKIEPKSTSSGYESARRFSPRRGRVNMSAPRDQRKDLRGGDRLEMVKASRFVARNSGFHRDASSTMALYAIGDGLTLRSQAEDPEIAQLYNEAWAEWSMRPEITGQYNLYALQYLISQTLDVDGEIWAVRTTDLFGNPRVQILETHHVSAYTNEERRIYDGIEYDAVWRPKFVHLVRDGKMAYSSDTIPIPASAVMHIREPSSVSGGRGLPTIQHGLNFLRDEAELLAFETQAVKQASEMGLVIKSNREGAIEDGDWSMDSEGDSPPTDEQALAERMGARISRINTDEELQSFMSNRPSSLFTGHLATLEREAAGGHIPYEVLRDASKIGGASVRLVASKADRRFRYRQDVIIQQFLIPAWGYCIGSKIANGDLPAGKGWTKTTCERPRKFSVDAGREEQQERLNVETGMGLWSDWVGSRGGGGFDEWLKQRKAQARKILTAAGYDENEPIPLWMLYKPSGAGINLQEAPTE